MPLRHPRVYVAPRVFAPLTIDADLSKSAWRKASWSEAFVDIAERTAADAAPNRRCSTRFKCLWDDEYLYVAALIHHDRTTPIVATYTERNSPIFHRDSDFEVFVDPSGSCHNYKELELNALNTVWNLMLNKPYADGGAEHSGRVAAPSDPLYYEVSLQRTATRLLSGSLNGAGGGVWAVEIALSHSELMHRSRGAQRPAVGRRWRINFSRVERRGETNWVWQPQRTWDAHTMRFRGVVDMHQPESWGYLHFADERADASPTLEDPLWPARVAASCCYHAQHAHRQLHGSFATDLRHLCVDEAALAPFEVTCSIRQRPADDSPASEQLPPRRDAGFIVEVRDRQHDCAIAVDDERHTTSRELGEKGA